MGGGARAPQTFFSSVGIKKPAKWVFFPHEKVLWQKFISHINEMENVHRLGRKRRGKKKKRKKKWRVFQNQQLGNTCFDFSWVNQLFPMKIFLSRKRVSTEKSFRWKTPGHGYKGSDHWPQPGEGECQGQRAGSQSSCTIMGKALPFSAMPFLLQPFCLCRPSTLQGRNHLSLYVVRSLL